MILLPYCDRGRYGYIDSKGTVRIQASYEFAREFSEGRAFVRSSSDNLTLIDEDARAIRTFANAKVYNAFWDSVASVQIDGSCGLIGLNGEFLIEPRFWALNRFYHGVAVASEDGLVWGTVDRTGTWRVPPKFYSVCRGQENTKLSGARLSDDPKSWALIDELGTPISTERYMWIGVECSGQFPVRFSGNEFGLIDVQSHTIFRKRLSAIDQRVSVGTISASVDDLWGVLSNEGAWLCEPTWTSLGTLRENRRLVYVGGKRDRSNLLYSGMFGYLNEKNELTIPEAYSRASDFSNGIARVYESEGERDFLAYIRLDGSVIWKQARK